MPLIIKVNVAAFGPDDVFTEKGKLTRKFARCAKDAYAEMGSLWHDKILPLHFLKTAKHRYHYAPRSWKYRLRRDPSMRPGSLPSDYANRKKGVAGDTDMVFSGDMRKQMQQFATIRAYPTRATVNVQAPTYMTLRPNTFKGSTQPDKFRELSQLTQSDYKTLETKLQQRIEAAMKR